VSVKDCFREEWTGFSLGKWIDAVGAVQALNQRWQLYEVPCYRYRECVRFYKDVDHIRPKCANGTTDRPCGLQYVRKTPEEIHWCGKEYVLCADILFHTFMNERVNFVLI